MNEESGRDEGRQADTEDELRRRDSEATSKETLTGLERSERDAESNDAPGDADVPSPDGADDDSRKPDDAGPM